MAVVSSARAWRAVVLCTAMAMTRGAFAAFQCSAIGRPAPSVTTIMAAPNDTANAAWVLRSDCTFDIVALVPAENGAAMLNCTDRGIGRIESLPSKVEMLHAEFNTIASADFTNYTNLSHIILAWNSLQTADSFKFPSSLQILDFDSNQLKGIVAHTIPNTVHTVYLALNQLDSLANFSLPASVTVLHLEGNEFTSINFPLPDGLVELHMDTSKKLKTIENVTLPNSLTTFTCTDCAVESFRGVQLSSELTTLDFTGATLTEFEIRESDVAILKRIEFSGDIKQTACKSTGATLRQVRTVPTCVLSDSVFATKYAIRPDPTSTAAPSGSRASSNAPSPTDSVSSSSSSSTVIITVAVVTAVVCVAGAIVVYRKCARKTASSEGHHQKHTDTSTANATSETGESSVARHYVPPEFLNNDIRNDEAFIAYRIAYDEIQIIRLIGKGGFGIIHLGRYRGQDVAVKQILPDRAKDMRVVRSFMDEIRLCVTLEHPSIVRFIGLMWSTLQDMAVVSEFMAGGDLYGALERQPGPGPSEWFEPSANLKAKSSLALDVIVALVYLHSFDHPIIHRDLKARNVLLNADGDAKLTDFGTSREALLDETMTGEIGTVAWIAPEVLRGERYNEKADIYSLGVLLVELDTARHPYRQEIVESGTAPPTNTQIALMVSTGKLVPTPSPECPSDVSAMVTKCLSYVPEDRPSAMEIHYELRQVVRHRTG